MDKAVSAGFDWNRDGDIVWLRANTMRKRRENADRCHINVKRDWSPVVYR